jgi:hypothetical protein
MPNNGDYGKGSSDRGKTDMIYLPGSPDYLAMMGSKAYKKDMYDAMGPKHTTPTTDPNTGIQGSGGGPTGDKSKPADGYGKEGNTYKKDYANMTETMPKEVQKSPGKKKKKGKKKGPVKSIDELRSRSTGMDY